MVDVGQMWIIQDLDENQCQHSSDIAVMKPFCDPTLEIVDRFCHPIIRDNQLEKYSDCLFKAVVKHAFDEWSVSSC